MRIFRWAIALGVGFFFAGEGLAAVSAKEEKPNIVFLMADDMGVGDVGCYGQTTIRTPNIDRLAAEGMRFTQCYSGSAICAPTRCALMTGLHTGHCTRRDNRLPGATPPLVPLRAEDRTVASAFKEAGYATGCIGKWGLGNEDTTGVPWLHGFDFFYGYLDQVHAHDYYTDYLWRNGQREEIEENKEKNRKVYSHDLFVKETFDFIRLHRKEPFFLYLAYTIPHGKFEVPSDEPYSNEPWTQQEKNYAAMITRLDADFGRLMALLQELGLDENTIVFFTSDNGPNQPWIRKFDSAAGLRGSKGNLYEGGIRAPMIVRWPERIAPGTTSDFVWSHVDFWATAAELAGLERPEAIDGVSIAPTLLGQSQPPLEFLYWEKTLNFHQAVRMGDWKGVRFGFKEPLELYDLANDPKESNDIAASHPDIVAQIEAIMLREHVESAEFPGRDFKPAPKPRQN